MNKKFLGSKIKALREAKNISQEELAHKLGYKSRSTVNKIEMGINEIPLSKLKKLCDILETDTQSLLSATNNEINELYSILTSLPNDKIEAVLEFVKKIK